MAGDQVRLGVQDVQGSGDDETVKIDLVRVPADVDKIAVCVTIHEADSRGQNFGQVSQAYIRVMNGAGGAEIARYDLSDRVAISASTYP